MPAFNSYELLFKYLAGYAEKERAMLLIDEYPYLVESSPQVSSILQAIIDAL